MPRFEQPRNLVVRSAHTSDAAAIREIYNGYVQTSSVTFDIVPRTLEAQVEWLQNRSGAHVVLVAVDGDELLGYASLSPFKERAAYSTTVEDSVYVSPAHHGRGVGGHLLGELVEVARRHGFHSMMARIVGGHEASVALHRAHGFDIVGVEREVGRKFGKWLDIVEMQLLL